MWSMRFFFPLNTCVKSALGPETAAICASLGFPSRSLFPNSFERRRTRSVVEVAHNNGVVHVGHPCGYHLSNSMGLGLPLFVIVCAFRDEVRHDDVERLTAPSLTPSTFDGLAFFVPSTLSPFDASLQLSTLL